MVAVEGTHAPEGRHLEDFDIFKEAFDIVPGIEVLEAGGMGSKRTPGYAG